MRFAAPVTVWGERHRVKLRRERHRHAAGDAVGEMIARDAREIERPPPVALRPPCRRTTEQIAPPAFAHQREHEIAMRIDVVHRDQQLAKSGLPEVLGKQLRVSAAEIARRRLLQLRRAADQSHITRQQCRRPRAESGGPEPPPERAARRRVPSPARPRARRRPRSRAPEDEPRQPRRQRSGAIAACASRDTRRRARRAPPTPTSSGRNRSETQRAESDAASGSATTPARRERPGDEATGTGASRTDADTAGERQKPFSSHSRCAPSIAANSAPTTPMPRPATISILTPAS